MPSAFIVKANKKPAQARANNSVNGADAESFAMAKVILACRGEGQWGSRQDDNSKIDLIFAADHPWHAGERMLVLCQVKSGPSYGSIVKGSDGFKLMGAAKSAAKRSSHDICVVWVDRDTDRAFWAYIHPNTRSDVQIYGQNHEVSPAMVWDLARCMAGRGSWGGQGGSGVVLPDVTGQVKARRKLALETYRRIGSVQSPTLGKIELTRFGWRHMFRISRASVNKNASLNIIPRLASILKSRPSVTSVTSFQVFNRGDQDHRVCEYLLKYERVALYRKHAAKQKNVTVHIRVVEEVRYPRDWANRAMLSQSVERRVVLKSAYYKDQ